MHYTLASFPRSGNTLVRLLLYKHFGIAVPSSYGVERELSRGESNILNVQEIDTGVVFWKTHRTDLVINTHGALVIVRDGRDALVSLAHYKKDFGGSNKSFEERLLESCYSGLWAAFHEAWLSRRQNVFMLRYEDLVSQDPVPLLEEALHAVVSDRDESKVVVRCPFHCVSFDKYHEENPRFFRRGVVGAWRDEMPSSIEELFWERYGAVMLRMGYTR